MGAVKRKQLEDAEDEYNRQIQETQEWLDETYPDEDWDAEDYLAFEQALEKDD